MLMTAASAHFVRRTPHRKRAFTLVELLVVVAIIAMLASMLLVAVQRGRESSRRASCGNNLRQIAIAVLAYESANGVFPASVVGNGACTGANAPADTTGIGGVINMSGMVALLPHLDEQVLFDQADRKSAFSTANTSSATPVGDPETNGNLEVCMTRLPVFECPTATNGSSAGLPTGHTDSTRFYSNTANGTGKGRTTNYTFITGTTHGTCDYWRTGAVTLTDKQNRCLFGEESFAKPGVVRDGVSNVLMLGETTSNNAFGSAAVPGFAWAIMDDLGQGIDPALTLNEWAAGTSRSPGRLANRAAAGSEHVGGAHFAVGDGGVRFASETISTTVLVQLARIADGETPVHQFDR